MIYSIWSFTAQGTLIALAASALLTLIVLFVRRPIARSFGAKWAYALWAVPFARLLLPPLMLPAGWGARFAAHTSAETLGGRSVASSDSLPLLTDTPVNTVASPATIDAGTALMSFPWEAALLGIWASGTLLSIGLLICRHRRFMQTVAREARPVKAALADTAAAVAGAIGYRGRAVICSSLISSGPMVTGLLRPIVLLPEWFEDDYSPVQQRAAIAHELTHAKRGDLLALQAAQIFVALQWFNPLAYLALRAFRSDQEAACDADVLRAGLLSRRDYGHALLQAARMSMPRYSPALAAGLPMTHSLKERLTMMQHPPATLTRRVSGASLLVLLGIAACTTAAIADPSPQPLDREITITNDKMVVDGKTYKDRTMFLLDGPFTGARPDLDALKYDLEDMKTLKFEDLEGLEEMKALKLEDLEGLEDFIELEILSKLGEEGMTISVDTDHDVDLDEGTHTENDEDVQVFVNDEGQKVINITRSRIENSGDGQDVHVYVNRAGQEGQDGREMRVKIITSEASDAAEASFSSEMDEATPVLASLADACVAHQFTDDAPAILTRKSEANGETYSSLCINRNGMDEETLASWIEQNSQLSDAERSALLQQQSGHRTITWRYQRELDGGEN